jgi:hypothetical protein
MTAADRKSTLGAPIAASGRLERTSPVRRQAGWRHVDWQDCRGTLGLFLLVALSHFVVSVAGVLVALPAAFDTQAGFWEAPGKAALAWISAALLAPLDWLQPLWPARSGFGYVDIAVISILFGAAAVGLARLWRAFRGSGTSGRPAG